MYVLLVAIYRVRFDTKLLNSRNESFICSSLSIPASSKTSFCFIDTPSDIVPLQVGTKCFQPRQVTGVEGGHLAARYTRRFSGTCTKRTAKLPQKRLIGRTVQTCGGLGDAPNVIEYPFPFLPSFNVFTQLLRSTWPLRGCSDGTHTGHSLHTLSSRLQRNVAIHTLFNFSYSENEMLTCPFCKPASRLSRVLFCMSTFVMR
jgi:hypothetical protein